MKIFLNEKKINRIIAVSGEKFKAFVNTVPTLKKELSLSYYDIDKLYAKGGVAREALMAYVKYENGETFEINVRDRDFIFFGDEVEYSKISDHKRIHPGIDVDYSESFNEYIDSRDFIFNQVLLNRKKMLFTKDAYETVKNKIIIPSEKDDEYDNTDSDDIIYVSGRIYARLIYFSVRYDYKINENIKYKYIDEKNLLVCLIKSYELGLEDEYYIDCYYYGIIPEDIGNSDEWLIYLMLKRPDIRTKKPVKEMIKSIRNYDIYEFLSNYDPRVVSNIHSELYELEKDNIKKYMNYIDIN